MAVSPPVQLALEKQRRLCLVGAHLTCATYGAAVAAYSGPAERPTFHSRPIARMTPVILDQGRFDLRIPTLRAGRASGQVVLVGVLLVAFVAILLARPSADSGAGPLAAAASAPPGAGSGVPGDVGGPSPTAAAVAATATPSPTAESSATVPPASPSSAPASSPEPSPGASAQPATSGATYRVKRGDNLYAIAAHFGTTAKALIKLNGIADPSKLQIGQILKLP